MTQHLGPPAQASAAPPSKARSWYLASRPHTLNASTVPVFVGAAVAAGVAPLNWLLFVCTLLGSMLVQIGTNLTDEYVDHRKHGGEVKFPAPHKVLARKLLTEREVLGGIVATFGVATLLGLYLTSQAGWPILAVAGASLSVAYLYSAGPLPLGDIGLGEITVFIFMGPLMVMATYYVQHEQLAWPAFWASIPVALLVTSIMHCNNIRDMDEDRRTGKRTLARLLGPSAARAGYGGFLALAYLSVAALVVADRLPIWTLASLATVPLAVANVRRLSAARVRPDFNRVLLHGSRLHNYTGSLLAAGLVVHAIAT